MTIAVVDTGIGNLGAIPNMLKRLGAEARVTHDRTEIARADRLILPGVGAFDAAMTSLRQRELVEVLNQRALHDGVPILGVCLGMQLLGAGSEEGELPGLGWIAGRSVRFRFDAHDGDLRIPHMGWSFVTPAPGAILFRGFETRPRFYFAHSYHLVIDDPADAAGTTHYGYPFVSAVAHGNIAGIQFHPEKSHRFGLKVLENFVAG